MQKSWPRRAWLVASNQRTKTQKLRTKSAWFARSKKDDFSLESPRSEELGKQLGFFCWNLVQRWFSDMFSFFYKWQGDLYPNMPVVYWFSWWNFAVLGVCCSRSQYSHYSHEAPTQSLTSHGANMCKWCDRPKKKWCGKEELLPPHLLKIYSLGTQMTLVLVGKGLVLQGWPSKIDVFGDTSTHRLPFRWQDFVCLFFGNKQKVLNLNWGFAGFTSLFSGGVETSPWKGLQMIFFIHMFFSDVEEGHIYTFISEGIPKYIHTTFRFGIQPFLKCTTLCQKHAPFDFCDFLAVIAFYHWCKFECYDCYEWLSDALQRMETLWES